MERMDLDQWSARDVARLLALVENERRYYQDLVADLPVALAILAADRSVVCTNRAFRQLLGARTEDLRGKTVEQVLPSDVKAAQWNRRYVQMGMTTAGRDFLKQALTAMGCADRAEEIKSVPDLMDFDEGRIE